MYQDQSLAFQIVMVLVPLILSLSVHEWAHAFTAWRLGDDTAARQGRLTLNPISHIDPIGTLLLPVVLVASGSGFFFGWAKPVPVTPMRLTRKVSMRTGMMITAAAGPASNVVLAVLSALVLGVVYRQTGEFEGAVVSLCLMMISLNLVLAIFNMIPLPPLDGSKVLFGILPDKLARSYDRFLSKNADFATMGLFVIILAGGRFLFWPVDQLTTLLLQMAGIS